MNVHQTGDQHSSWFWKQSAFHILIAVGLLISPFVLSQWLTYQLFIWPGHAWTRTPESAIKSYFLSSPYWWWYRVGFCIGLLPTILATAAGVGLWKQRDWGRCLACAFHELVSVSALMVILFNLPIWFFPVSGGPDSLAGVAYFYSAVIIGIATAVLVLSGGYLVYLLVPATRARFTSVTWRKPLAYVAVTIASAVAIEFVVNRLAVYEGDATYQGESTGYWLSQLASQQKEARLAAVKELRKDQDSVPVLCEIYRGKAASGAFRFPDGTHSVYWSRAHTAPEIYRKNLIGEPLVLALAKLAQDSDPNIRNSAIGTLRRLCPDDPRTASLLIEALQDVDSKVREYATYALSTMVIESKTELPRQLIDASNNPQLSRNGRGWARKAIRHAESTSMDDAAAKPKGRNRSQLKLTHPNGGERLERESEFEIRWDSVNVGGPVHIQIHGGLDNNRGGWWEVAHESENNGSYFFTIPKNWGYDKFKVKITSADGSLSDESNGYFLSPYSEARN